MKEAKKSLFFTPIILSVLQLILCFLGLILSYYSGPVISIGLYLLLISIAALFASPVTLLISLIMSILWIRRTTVTGIKKWLPLIFTLLIQGIECAGLVVMFLLAV